MKKLVVMVYVRNFLVTIILGIVFIIALSCLIVGIGQKKIPANGASLDIPEYNVEPNSIVFNDKNGGGPIIQVYVTKENKIEDMYVEEYVRGVVAAEMPAEFGLEALKAQAVAARTYALAHMELFGGTKSKDANGADLTDTINDQVYMTKDSRLNAWPEKSRGEYWNKITEAVIETSGEVITYDGKLVMAPYYFATSSGKTENALDVFAENEPYLKSVNSPGEEAAPKYKTTSKFSYSEIASKINSSYPKAGLNLRKLKSQISIKSRTSAGSVKQIKAGGVTISGANFRGVLGLNSANFTISFGITGVDITCIGYGHDVGMSQWGANAMAKDGKNYKDILCHYYTGVQVQKISDEEWKIEK